MASAGEGSGRGRRGHTPFVIAVETTADGRPLYARLQVVRGSRLLKPSGYALVSRLELPSSATAGSGFVALPTSRSSSMSAMSRTPIAPPPDTPPSTGQIPFSPTSKTASWPRTAPSRPTSPSLPRRLCLAFQPPLRPEGNPRAADHRRHRDPANTISPPQTG
jgi:hypothetical protein